MRFQTLYFINIKLLNLHIFLIMFNAASNFKSDFSNSDYRKENPSKLIYKINFSFLKFI